MDYLTAMTQALLGASGERIVVDGLMGPRTRNSLKRNPKVSNLVPSLQRMVTLVEPKLQKTNSALVPRAVVVMFAKKASAVTGVPVNTLMWMIGLEATKKKGSGSTMLYDARSISNTRRHKGLGQLYDDAWAEAEEYRRRRYPSVAPLGNFEDNWMDPEKSVMAMACYSRLTEQYAKPLIKNLKFTDPVRYALYNQGAGFITKVLDGDLSVLGNQSDESGKIRMEARNQILAA
jgi:hypothetical protein